MSKSAFFFNLDGVIATTGILPCIAAELGVSDEIDTLTRLTIAGHIPFEDTMRLCALIFGQVPLARVHKIMASIPLEPALLDFINKNSECCFAVTGSLDIWIEPLVQKLGCRVFSSNATLKNNKVHLLSVLSKDSVICEFQEKKHFNRVVAVGNGVDDIAMLKSADIGIAYGGGHIPCERTIQAANIVVYNGEVLCKLLKAL